MGGRIRAVVLLAAVTLVLVSAGPAMANSCNDSWTGQGATNSWFDSSNWSAGVPTTFTNACIDGSGDTVLIDGSVEAVAGSAVAASLTLGGSSGTQTLVIQGDTSGSSPNGFSQPASLSLGAGGGSITGSGVLDLTSTCGDAQNCTDGGSASLTSAGTLTNDGTINAQSGTDSGSTGRFFSGPLVNEGLIQTDGNGASLYLKPGSTLDEDSGTTSPSDSPVSDFPADPAVIVDGSTLNYTGTGASTIVAQGHDTLTGNLGSAQNLVVEGNDGSACTLGSVAATSSFTNAGAILLAEPSSCGSELSVGPTSATKSSATLTNTGTIMTEQVGSPGTTYLNGNLDNDGGTILLAATARYEGSDPASNSYTGATLDNQGKIQMETGGLTLPAGAGATLDNDTGGLITTGQSVIARKHFALPLAGGVFVDSGSTFIEGAGTTVPSLSAPAGFPAVYVDGGSLSYTGTGSSSIIAEGSVALSGNLASGQGLTVQGLYSGQSCVPGVATEAAGFTNAGTITLTNAGAGSAPCGGELAVSSGTLANPGTIASEPGFSPTLNQLVGDVTSGGTLQVDQTLDFRDAGKTLTQTGGVSSIAAGQTLDLTGSGEPLGLQGGTLDGSGSVSGAVNNTGGDVEPGDPSGPTPGQLTVTGNYTQGPGGKLTVLVSGSTTPGVDYSQLSSGSSALAGGLGIVALSGFTPQTGESLKIIDDGTGSRTGTFATITGQFPSGPSAGYDPLYDPSDVTLSYQALNQLTVSATGPGSGTITSSPSGIDCGASCQAWYFPDQTVTLTGHPASGSAFGTWSGACSGSASSCRVQMNSTQTVAARFLHATTTALVSSLNAAKVGEKVTYTATVSPHPSGGAVRFISGGKTISRCGAVAVSSRTGKATCSVKYGSTGLRKIQAIYSGTSSFARSASSTLTERIKKA